MKFHDPNAFQQAILSWFAVYGRKELPWQNPITPYRVWISEIMLQQTQVSTVIPFFQKFIKRFPDIKTLAEASEDDVLAHWAGLGYYARARNLHKAAKILEEDYLGQMPDDLESIMALPGIGRSTAAAILSIAFKKPAAILDGNVKRVLARLQAIEGWPGNSKVHDRLWEVAEHYKPMHSTAEYTQAMMDIGATLCTRTKPQCEYCPVQDFCQAYKQGNSHDYPGKKPKKALPVKQSYLLVLKNAHDHILLYKRNDIKLWGGLWSLPEYEGSLESKEMRAFIHRHWQSKLLNYAVLEPFRHTFSHFHWDITPILCETSPFENHCLELNSLQWISLKNINDIGIPAPVKKILSKLKFYAFEK